MIGLDPILYALGDDPFQPLSPGGEMKCPTCGENTPESWSRLSPSGVSAQYFKGAQAHNQHVHLDWMLCANPECKELVIRVHESELSRISDSSMPPPTSWLARPRTGGRVVDVAVPDPYRVDYLEAAAILDISSRMSAVLSRRILADILEKYAKLTDFSLKARIDAFVADKNHPRDLRQNLGHFIEIGNFGAHTQTNDQGEIVNVDQEEAAWMLDLVERLFDYFIVSPEKDRKIREAFDEKLNATKRKPIDTPPEEESS